MREGKKMEERELVTLSKYATTHRLSLHQVVKKVRSGELETVVKNQGGKEVVYVIQQPSAATEKKESETRVSQDDIDYKKAYETLLGEYNALKAEYETLKAEKIRHKPYRPRGISGS